MLVLGLRQYQLISLHGKPHFLFPGVLKRWSFQENCAGIWSGKMMFLFPENMILHLRRHMKDDLSQKNTEIWYFHQNFWKDGIFKKGRAGTWSFLYYLEERWYFFPRKYDIFSLGRNWEKIFLKKYMEIWYFLCTRMGVTNVVSHPSSKKKSKMVLSRKNTPKGDWRPNWHPRKSSSNSLYFHGDLSCIVQVFSCIALQRIENRKLHI